MNYCIRIIVKPFSFEDFFVCRIFSFNKCETTTYMIVFDTNIMMTIFNIQLDDIFFRVASDPLTWIPMFQHILSSGLIYPENFIEIISIAFSDFHIQPLT